MLPERIDLLEQSPAFRYFYEAHFESLIAARNEVDWHRLRSLSKDELALARRLIRANLNSSQEYRDAAGILNDREAIPLLHDLLRNTRELSLRIGVARPLWFLERAPIYPELIEQLVRSTKSQLKIQHIWEILLLADERVIDHLFTMAEDKDQKVRDLALGELARLSRTRGLKGWLLNREDTPDLAYLVRRRADRRFNERILRQLSRDHAALPLFDAE